MSLNIFILLFCSVFLIADCGYPEYDPSSYCIPSKSVQYVLDTTTYIAVTIEPTNSGSSFYPFDCHVTIIPPSGSYVLLSLVKLNRDKARKCATSITVNNIPYCDDKKLKFYQSTPGSFSFFYHTEGVIGYSKAFKMYANSFKYAPCDYSWDFRCDNGRCISKKLVRDGIDNCGDNSDEKRISNDVGSDCTRQGNSVLYVLGTGRNSSIFLQAWEDGTVANPFECRVTILAPQHGHVLLKVVALNKDVPGLCRTYIVIDNYFLCNNNITRLFTANNSQKIVFSYHVEGRVLPNRAFQMYATSYKLAPCNGMWDFLCNNGYCISSLLIGDRIDNCGDNSDEVQIRPCNQRWDFLCGNGKCIPSSLVRNGVDDCGDNSDEKKRTPVTTGKEFPGGAVVGIVIGVLLLIASVSGAIWLFKRNTVVTRITYVRQ